MTYRFDVVTGNNNTNLLTDPSLVEEHFICECRHISGSNVSALDFKPSPRKRDVGGSVLDSGFDAFSPPLGRPVWWRIEQRGLNQVYCSSFWMTSEEISRRWGKRVAHEGRGAFPVTIETLISTADEVIEPMPSDDGTTLDASPCK
jgi:hypothetical protein